MTAMAAATIALLAVLGTAMFPKSYKVATWYATTPTTGSLTSGTGLLGGQTNADGSACFWLGSGEDRAALLWPPGYSARGNPLSIFDEKGQMISTVGEVVTSDGGVAAEDVIAKRYIRVSKDATREGGRSATDRTLSCGLRPGDDGLPKRAVVDLLLSFEGFLAAAERLEVAAAV
jgi:hypothetical protein